MLARATASATRVVIPHARAFSTIEVNTVCQVVTGNAGNEANAIKMDALLDANLGAFKGYCSGIASIERKVCKSEWTYVVQVNFDSAESLHSYLEDPAYATVIKPVLGEFAALSTVTPHVQNFVNDTYTPAGDVRRVL